MGDVDLPNLILIVVLVLLSGFFSSSESAYLTLRGTARLAHLVNIGAPGAARVARMVEDPARLFSTILLGNNLVNIGFTAVVTALFITVLDDQAVGILVATAIGTSVILVFGEIIPKTFAVRFPERIATLYAFPLRIVELAFLPIVVLLDWVSGLANIGASETDEEKSITEGELRTLIDIGEAEGALETEEAALLESVFRFGDREVRDMMTPRTEIVFMERGADLGHFLEIYAEHSHTRFPVYKEDEDNIVGILSAKDILKAMSSKAMKHEESVTSVIRDAFFVPETKRIAELFDELRKSGNQMAIVVDEFGGISGLVTLKRLLEEVAGRVGEEGVSPEEEFEAIGENTFQVDGGMSIDEAIENFGFQPPEGEFETMAGFALEVLGHIPKEGERFEHGDFRIEVTKMSDLKIETLTLYRNPTPPQVPDSGG